MSIIDRIKQEEGFRQFPYQCPAGKTSIGYGRNLEDRGISEEEALFLLQNDVREAEADLHIILSPTPPSLTLPRWEALVDMRFQLGAKGFRRFARMIEAARAGDWDTAADECMDSLYAQQVPARAERNATALKLG